MERSDFGLRSAVKLDIDGRGDVVAQAMESLGCVVALSVAASWSRQGTERVLQHLEQKSFNSQTTPGDPQFLRSASDSAQNGFQLRPLLFDPAAGAPSVISSKGGWQ